MVYIPNLNLINKQLAEDSHKGTSWDPEKRAEQEIEGFGGYVRTVYDELAKHAKTETQKSFLNEEMKRFEKGFADKYNTLLSAKGRTISTFITGGSNFPTRKAEKANSAEQNRYDEMIEFKNKAEASILRELKKMGVEEAGGELEVLKKKIADAERNHEFMVKANAIIRKKISDDQKIKEIQAIGKISDKTAHEILKPDFMGRIGFPAYALSNDTANIHRMKERLIELEKKESTPTSETQFSGGTIIDNATEDRIQIQFDSIPSQELRTKLKGEGWRWSPHNGVWQRKRTDQAIWSAERILGIKVEKERFVHQKAVSEEVKEIKQELRQGETVTVPEVNLKEAVVEKDNPELAEALKIIKNSLDVWYESGGTLASEYSTDMIGSAIAKTTYKTRNGNPDLNRFLSELKKLGYNNLKEWYDPSAALLEYANKTYFGEKQDIKKELAQGETVTIPETTLKSQISASTPSKKELWEMTYQEFAAMFQDKYNDSGFSFAERIGKPLGVESQAGEPLRIINGKKRGYPQSLIRDRWRYVILQDAINRGKKLSSDIMSDYLENQKNFPILLEGSAKPDIAEAKKEISKGETVIIAEVALKTDLKPMKNIVATYRKLAWDAKEKGKYKQAAEFYEIAIKDYELHSQEGELYKADLASLKKLHAEMLLLSKVQKNETAEVSETVIAKALEPTPTIEGAKWRKFSDHKSETKAVKEALNRAGIEAEVGHGRGTGWSWLEINVGDPRLRGGVIEETRQYTQEEQNMHKKVLDIAKEVTGRHGEYDGNISLMAQDWRIKARKTPPSAPSSGPVKNWLIKSKDGKFTLTLMYSTEKDAIEYANKTYHGEFSLHESPKKEQYIPKVSDAELEKAREEGKRIRQDLEKGETVKVPESTLVEIKGQVGIVEKSEYVSKYPREKASYEVKFMKAPDMVWQTDIIEATSRDEAYSKIITKHNLDLRNKEDSVAYPSIKKVSDPSIIKKDIAKGETVTVPESKLVELKGQTGIPDEPPYGKEYPRHRTVRILVETDKNGKEIYYQTIDPMWKKRISLETVNSLKSEGRAFLTGPGIDAPISKEEFYKPKYWQDPKAGRHPASGSGKLQANQVPFIEARDVGGKMVWYMRNPHTNEEFYFDYDKLEDAKKKYTGFYDEYLKTTEVKHIQKPLPPKYKIGEMVYSWQNPSIPAEIIRVNLSNELGYSHTYILRLKNKGAGGGSSNSKYINEESLSYSPLSKPEVHEVTILPQIKKEVARGETVVVPQSLLMKKLEAPSMRSYLYLPQTNPKPLLEKGKTIEISGNKLGEMLQISGKIKTMTKIKAQTREKKAKAKEHQPCTPPVHVHAYRRGCPTKRRK